MIKDFNNEKDANLFRAFKRQEGFAASVFNYGKDRFRVKLWEKSPVNPERTQWVLSDNARVLSQDIEDLTKIKELITNPNFGNEIEDVVFVAKRLQKEEWFHYPNDVINFFDGISEKELDKITVFIDDEFKGYDDEWNDKLGELA